MKNRIITLLSDFGTRDPFVGVMKGVIHTINPRAIIVDLTHEISPQDIFEGAFSLYQSYGYFPDDTIHLAVVDPGVGGGRKAVIVRAGCHLFVAPDNGVASLAAQRESAAPEVFEITNPEYTLGRISSTFHGRDVFAPAAAYLSKGVLPGRMGARAEDFIKIKIPEVLIEGSIAAAAVIHTDRFGNLITNIDGSLRERIARIKVRNRVIEKISNSYEQGKQGELLAIFGSTGFLEISINKESASEYTGLKKGDDIIVDLK